MNKDITTITVQKKTRNLLLRKKMVLDAESLDEVINIMDKLITKFKLSDELKEVKNE